MKSASRDVHDREQRPINLNLWRDSGDVENTQVGKSHWNIKKMSIMGTILYLFFRTQEGKRIYFLISLAMKKVLYLFFQKGQIQCLLKKSPLRLPEPWVLPNLRANQCGPEDVMF